MSLGKEFYLNIFKNVSTLKILLHCRLTYIVSSDNSVIILIFVPLSFFPGCPVGFLFVTSIKQFDYHVHCFSFLHVFCTWVVSVDV